MKKRVATIYQKSFKRSVTVAAVAVLVLLLVVPLASAERFQSGSYTIDSSVANSFGGSTAATDYKMSSSGGEAVIGDGSSGSYKLGQGYIPQQEKSLELDVQPSNVIAYYAMDEDFGTTTYDDSLNTANGLLSGNPVWSAGKIGRALTFNGTSGYVSVSSASSNNIETLTVSAWVQTTQVPGASTAIVQKWAGSGAYPYGLVLNTDGTVSFSASDGTHTPVASSVVAVNNGSWHHIAGVRTAGGTLKIYVDGDLKNSVADTTVGTTTNSTILGMGRRASGGNYFAGTIDEVKIFNAALSDEALKSEYIAQNSGLRSSYTFNALGTTSQTVNANVIVQTDAPSYTINLSQNQALTQGSSSISPISGSITTPALWNEGTTNGFGFSIISGPGVDSKWGTGPNYKYAAVPGTATTIQSRGGYTGGVKDQYTLQYRADVPTSQVSGSYKNQVTYSATMLP